MGFHALDIVVVVAVALLLFGPKTLQSISRSAGKGLGQAKDMKNKVLAELPMEDLSKVTDTLSQIPTSPQQAAKQFIKSTVMPAEKTEETEENEPGASKEPVQGTK